MSKMLTYGTLLFVMIAWGLNVIAMKVLVSHFPPLLITSLRIGLAGISLLMLLVFQKKLRALSQKEWIYTIAGGLLGMVGNQSLLSIGLAHTSATNGALLLALVPLTTSILAVVFLNDRLTLFRVIGIVLALVGVAFVVLKRNGAVDGIGIGDAYVFGAMLSQAFSFIWINKATETLAPRQATAIMITMSSIIMFVMSLFIHPYGLGQLNNGTIGVWIIFVSSAIVATAISQMLYNMAIQRIGASKSSVFMNLEPLFALLGAYVFLEESIGGSQILGFVFIVSGVLFGTGYMDEKFNKTYRSAKDLDKCNKPGL